MKSIIYTKYLHNGAMSLYKYDQHAMYNLTKLKTQYDMQGQTGTNKETMEMK